MRGIIRPLADAVAWANRLRSYAGYRRAQAALRAAQTECVCLSPREQAYFEGWPRNHAYRIQAGGPVPNFRLYERAQQITRHYHPRLTSFLDIGCCRGYYVLEAASRPGCNRSVGVDVTERFITAAKIARKSLRLDESRVQFDVASLGDIAARPEAFGAPFDTILLVGTYHYLYWGMDADLAAPPSHDSLLASLAAICRGHVLFSGRMEVDELPDHLMQRAKRARDNHEYTLEGFRRAAGRYFDVKPVGRLGSYDLLDLTKRGGR